MPNRKLYSTFTEQDGSPLVGATIKVSLLESFVTLSGIVDKGHEYFATDGNGYVEINITVPETGSAKYSFKLPDGYLYTANIESGPTVDLMTVITLISTSVSEDTAQKVIDIHDKNLFAHSVSSHNLHQSTRTKYAYDDFDANDNTQLNNRITPTGHKWTTTVQLGSQPQIIGKKISCVNGYNSYNSLDFGSPDLKSVGGAFSFVPGTGLNDISMTCLTLIMDVGPNQLLTMLHLILGPTSWTLTKRVNGGTFDVLAFGSCNLLIDGSVYQANMEVSGNTVTIYLPDGSVVSVTDAAIGSMALRYGGWQLSSDTNAVIGRWHVVYMGAIANRAVYSLGGQSPMSEIKSLKGNGITKRQIVNVSNLPDSWVWYRISTKSSMQTFAIFGCVLIDLQGLNKGIALEINCKYILGGSEPSIAVVQKLNFGNVIQYMRLSSNGTEIALDMYGDLSGCSGTITFIGYFSPVNNIVEGATDYVTHSTGSFAV